MALGIEDVHLGDGVYASFDGYHICLDLRAQGDCKIALEPVVLAKLDEFRKHVGDAVEAYLADVKQERKEAGGG